MNDPVANRTFGDLDALEEVLVTRCRTLREDQHTISDLTHSWRWPSEQHLPIQDRLSGPDMAMQERTHSAPLPDVAARSSYGVRPYGATLY